MGEEVVTAGERHALDRRIRRLNDLGFDIDELELVATGDEHQLRLRPQVVEAGHHRRRLERLVGLDVQENQARRLLNDIAAFGAWLERDAGRAIPEAVVAYRWLTEVFEPVVDAVPVDLRGKLEPAEVFHEVLAGSEVGTAEAVASYLRTVLVEEPDEQHLLLDGEG
jgi:malonyl CoA-acyl carrier protein transacylase